MHKTSTRKHQHENINIGREGRKGKPKTAKGELFGSQVFRSLRGAVAVAILLLIILFSNIWRQLGSLG